MTELYAMFNPLVGHLFSHNTHRNIICAKHDRSVDLCILLEVQYQYQYSNRSPLFISLSMLASIRGDLFLS